uniref:Uncharacterized protein n=1 Tax=Trypanosoma congolense (strain IL3000) TaxID=1068625 RepID=F9W857_TRYCI|nr:hypothetical protein, unlikely [Trypanosoma congolense IL3000]
MQERIQLVIFPPLDSDKVSRAEFGWEKLYRAGLRWAGCGEGWREEKLKKTYGLLVAILLMVVGVTVWELRLRSQAAMGNKMTLIGNAHTSMQLKVKEGRLRLICPFHKSGAPASSPDGTYKLTVSFSVPSCKSVLKPTSVLDTNR